MGIQNQQDGKRTAVPKLRGASSFLIHTQEQEKMETYTRKHWDLPLPAEH